MRARPRPPRRARPARGATRSPGGQPRALPPGAKTAFIRGERLRNRTDVPGGAVGRSIGKKALRAQISRRDAVLTAVPRPTSRFPCVGSGSSSESLDPAISSGGSSDSPGLIFLWMRSPGPVPSDPVSSVRRPYGHRDPAHRSPRRRSRDLPLGARCDRRAGCAPRGCEPGRGARAGKPGTVGGSLQGRDRRRPPAKPGVAARADRGEARADQGHPHEVRAPGAPARGEARARGDRDRRAAARGRRGSGEAAHRDREPRDGAPRARTCAADGARCS